MVQKLLHVLLLLVLSGSLAVAQATTGVTPSPPLQSQQGMGEMPGMNKGTEAVTGLVQTCDRMMQKQMALMPLAVTAISVIGVLLALALLFFVVLEIQWIRYWTHRLKRENQVQPR